MMFKRHELLHYKENPAIYWMINRKFEFSSKRS